MSRKKKVLLIILSILLIILTILFIFVLTTSNTPVQNIEKPVSNSLTPLSAPMSNAQITDTMEGWNTYTNEYFGIEFKYPENYVVDETIDEGVPLNLTVSHQSEVYPNGKLVVVFFSKSTDANAEVSNIEETPSLINPAFTNIIINGEEKTVKNNGYREGGGGYGCFGSGGEDNYKVAVHRTLIATITMNTSKTTCGETVTITNTPDVAELETAKLILMSINLI
jgi:hypothetical protein